jgi:hypothetical protein
MAECEFLQACPFFNDRMPIEAGIGALYKQRYCKNNKDACARYMVRKALGKEKVPADLYPNMLERAGEIITKG